MLCFFLVIKIEINLWLFGNVVFIYVFFDSYLNNWFFFVIYCWYLNVVYVLLDMILVIEWNLVIRILFLFINILL